MTDANIISLAITLFAVAAGSLFNNVRITDSATATNRRLDDVRDLVRSVDLKLDRVTDTVTAMLNDHEQRIRSIEQQRPH